METSHAALEQTQETYQLLAIQRRDCPTQMLDLCCKLTNGQGVVSDVYTLETSLGCNKARCTCILAVGPTGLLSSLGGGKMCGHVEGHLVTSARVQAVVLHHPKKHN